MIEKVLRVAVGVACAYEACAIFTHRLPTISEMLATSGRNGDVAEGVVLGGLAMHFALGAVNG